MQAPTYADLVAAVPLVRRHLRPTPLIEWPGLSHLLGFRYLVKHENHLPTTAFKVRGGVHLVGKMDVEQRRRGVLGCTTGNHGQSLAYACRLFAAPCTLVVPVNANPDKIAAMQALGADIVAHGRDFDEAKDHCESLARERGLRYVHSANEPDLIAGVGTCGLEIFDDCPDADVVLVPVGLGSGVCGAALAASGRRPSAQIIGVQSEGAPAVTLSWRQGGMVQTDAITTFAEGVATRRPAEMTLEIMRQFVSDMILVSDDELRQGIRWLLQHTHNLAEGAGAAALAAAWKLRKRLRGKVVVGVLSGGNLGLRELARILSEA